VYATPKFNRKLEQQESRPLISTECGQCGARMIASAADGSLAEWEDHHCCGERDGASLDGAAGSGNPRGDYGTEGAGKPPAVRK
jgi:hypothetical protein